ncbi:helix-turn-helix domain-containing protein [Oceanobacillus oncorhynchi]|uniref:helix-turn-helix domain-containing protein n=1 Tax=Oceanobacillus oncorhynchi TaxID=545501 RepID=UPI002116C6BE|nr:helix-turn-helix transcriptional regulator [Oceanobacillus oncorhynchi]UUI39830.1 helix-turn-helix domain-containing protein [Oceanobacillus oncorhynchi]
MRMNIGPIITEKRKQKKITQQELADFLGVSKASVSKWETGQTYPDITSLPLLAAYFNVSIDSLLGYESQLNQKEIQRIYASLKGSFETKLAEDVLVSIRSFIRRYYSCYPFILQMGLLIINHIDRLPGENLEEKNQNYMNEAKDLFVHVRTHAKDPELITKAFKMEAYSLFTLKEADQVLEILGEYPPGIFPVESLISGAFQMKGDTDRAIGTLQSALFQYIIIVMSAFTNYLQVLIHAPDKFKETVQRGKAIAETFDLESLHPVSLMNFQLSAAYGYAQMKEEDASLSILEEFTKVIKVTDFPLVLHGDDYFDQVDDWLNNLDIGNQMPRDSMLVKENFINAVVDNPLFLNLEEGERFQQINRQLKCLLEGEEEK